jgi:lipoprotein NlpI
MRTLQSVFLLFLAVLSSCAKQPVALTSASDYNAYLVVKENKKLDFAQREIDFWQKRLEETPRQKSYLGILAANYSTLFQATANIQDLYTSEKLWVEYNESDRYSRVGSIRSLARNYISQHRFKEALTLANKAFVIGEGKKETQKLLFDVQMELGNYSDALQQLNAIKDMNDFDYLIRLAKWNDHKGDLETAISFMEKALNIAIKEDDKVLKIWSYSNLGDFYGHAGRIEESYKSYLKTLEIDSNYSYALKGIAWIVFSHERNTTEANRILNAISKSHNTPDFYLLKAQIAHFEGDNVTEEAHTKAYFQMLEKNKYGAMYNKYNVLLYAEEKATALKALAIAKTEVAHRPTPESYDLLAWSYLNLGKNKMALQIAQEYVVGKTFEPQALYHLAMIYKRNNFGAKVKPLKEELLSSSYELGPNFEHKIMQL